MIVSYSDLILINNDESCIFDHIDHVSAPLMVDVCKSWSTAKRKKGRILLKHYVHPDEKIPRVDSQHFYPFLLVQKPSGILIEEEKEGI